jgi:hypothetical protein
MLAAKRWYMPRCCKSSWPTNRSCWWLYTGRWWSSLACSPAYGQRVRPQSERGGYSPCRPAHSWHQPHAVSGNAGRGRIAPSRRSFPEVERVFAKTGTAEIATDPMPPNISDGYIFVMLKPQSPSGPTPHGNQGRSAGSHAGRLAKVPGNNYEFTQPIQMRFNELISGVRSDVAVKVFGDDMDVLNEHC